MFDKKLYRERRKAGQRGQVDLRSAPKIALWAEEDYKNKKCGKEAVGSERTSSVTMHYTKKGMVAVTRKMNRRKVVDRKATQKGFVYAIRIGGKDHTRLLTAKKKFAKLHKGERIPSEEQRIHLENHPLAINPKKTNHQRMLERKEQRDADATTRRAARSAETATV